MNTRLGDQVSDSSVVDNITAPGNNQSSRVTPANNRTINYNQFRNQSDAKRLLYNLNKVFFREKSEQPRDKGSFDGPVMPKLTIDVPD